MNWQAAYCNQNCKAPGSNQTQPACFLNELESVHYQQPPYSTAYPEIVHVRLVSCYNADSRTGDVTTLTCFSLFSLSLYLSSLSTSIFFLFQDFSRSSVRACVQFNPR